ncbi:hypothetical protein [Variovorax sp. LjRoot178]|uniref:hypothetical protein n=1 Tax=Variovorax sp. LjRoot178 TaxID=3342277 RepID=UPI003ED13254
MTRTVPRVPGHKHGAQPGTKARAALIATCLAIGMGFMSGASAQQGSVAGLAYDAQTQGAVPIPPSERALQPAVAEPWFKVSKEGLILEGAIFDRSGNLEVASACPSPATTSRPRGSPRSWCAMPGAIPSSLATWPQPPHSSQAGPVSALT